MRNAVRNWVEQTWGVQVVTWDQPADESATLYEVLVGGELLRADSLPLLVKALGDRVRVRRLVVTPALRLVA